MASNSFGDGWWLYGFTSATTIPRHHVMVCISLLFACKQLQCRRMGLGLLVNDCCTYLISSSIFAVVGEAPSMNAYASAKCQNLLPAYHIGRCLDEKCLGVEHCIFNLQACLGGSTFNEQFLEDSASILVHFAWYSIQFQSLFEVPKKRFEAFNFQYCSAFFFLILVFSISFLTHFEAFLFVSSYPVRPQLSRSDCQVLMHASRWKVPGGLIHHPKYPLNMFDDLIQYRVDLSSPIFTWDDCSCLYHFR